MASLVEIFYYVFLGIFGLTAIVAIGSITKVRPFHRVEPKYTSRLFPVLIVEVVGAVIIVFRQLPIPGKPFVELYNFDAFYQDYEQKVRDSLGPEEAACLRSPASPPTQQCLGVLNEVAAAHGAAGRVGQGQLMLIGKTGEAARFGVLLFRFPGATDPTAIDVMVLSRRPDGMTLRFTQSERALQRDGTIYIRPQFFYTIDYVESKDHGRFEGTLFNPQRRMANGGLIAEASTTITPVE